MSESIINTSSPEEKKKSDFDELQKLYQQDPSLVMEFLNNLKAKEQA